MQPTPPANIEDEWGYHTAISGDLVAVTALNESVTADRSGAVYVFQIDPTSPRAPTITAQPVNQTVNLGGTATFAVDAVGVPAPTYQWQRQATGTSGFVNLTTGGAYAGATGKSLTVIGVTAAMIGDQFRCVVSNGVDPAATTDVANLAAAAGSGIVGIFIPVNSQDSNSRPLNDGIWSVSAPPYPLDQRGIGVIVKPTWISANDQADFALHDHVYVGSNVPDPARAVVTYAFSAPWS